MIYCGVAGASDISEGTVFAQGLVAVLGGSLLIAGLWTPIAGALAALDEIWVVSSAQSAMREETWIRLCLAILAVSVAMIGPGAWSVDARLFGRKRFDIDRKRGRTPSP